MMILILSIEIIDCLFSTEKLVTVMFENPDIGKLLTLGCFKNYKNYPRFSFLPSKIVKERKKAFQSEKE